MEYQELDTVVSNLDDWFTAGEALRRHASSVAENSNLEEATKLGYLATALHYHFPTESGEEVPFGPMLESGESRYPEKISSMPPDVLQTWQEVFDATSAPILKSRLGDLLWVGKVEQPHRYAQNACDSYHDVAKFSNSAMTIAYSVVRALEIAKQINDVPRQKASVELAQSQVRSLLDNGSDTPGATLLIIRSLSPYSRKMNLGEALTELLDECAQAYQGSMHLLSSVRDLQVSHHRANTEKASAYGKLQAKEWIEESERSSGLIRMANLERAREFALSRGLSDELTRVRLMIEQASEEDLGLTELESDVVLPRERVERYKDSFFTGDSLQSFMGRFGSHCPLPEQHQEIEDTVRDLMRSHPIQYLTTRVVLNEENLPIRFIRERDDHFNHAVMQQQVTRVTIWMAFCGDIMDRALSQYPTGEFDYLAHFKTSLIKDEYAEVFARGFSLYQEERYDECVCVVIPRLEAAIREMARFAGVGIYSDPKRDSPGGYRTLGSLLSSLEGRMPENYRKYFLAAIGDPMGVNLRNRLCHGLLSQADRKEAALALQLATQLACLRPADPPSESSDSP
ncbi:DUF4209 domain-containing protein [Amycolatopsis sp. YIM 10]|uniref:DUF4209 domain-containing protein n=1 Tax=Amycolatopsis sp. YIM 10 TaxID=2653857 RepID=UPI0012A827FA|nr:DUF4209 domain-containing protein [Amycolatopsis sp. YIM 10]QFU94282.1 hypothetical protein YIM_45760 [Amycolatopsis sp. YIM 10]